MKALVWHGKEDVRVDSVDDPKLLEPTDAIVEITSTAICGSDLHLYDGYQPGMKSGDVLGHEPMGRVVEVGRAVKKLRLGYSHVLGGFSGGQAEYLRVPHADVGPLKVESDLRDDQVLFLSDIFPTGYMAAENAEVEPNDVVAVWGCGPVGQFAIQSAWRFNAGRVIAIDRVPERLALAERLGPAETINFEEQDVKGLTIRMGQTHMQRYMRPLLDLIEAGEIDPSAIITHRMKLQDAPEAYKTFRDKKDGCVKVVLTP